MGCLAQGPGASMRWRACFVACFTAAALGFAAGNALAQSEDEDQDSHILAAFAHPAADQPAPPPPMPSLPAEDPARFLLFATTDIWREGGFAYGGVLWAPTGLDRDGPVLKLMFGGGLYQYNSGALGNVTVVGREPAPRSCPAGGSCATTSPSHCSSATIAKPTG